MDDLPLYPGSTPCIRSGYCCSKAPCPFGEGVPCKHLEWEGLKASCAKYEYIKTQPNWELAPAFGAGCCSPLSRPRKP